MTLIQKPNPGDTCRMCNEGKLQARSRTQSNSDPRFGGPEFRPQPRLHELVCSACGVKFEPEHLGQDVNEFLEDQLISFENPPTKPETCPNCHSKDLVRGRTKTLLDHFPVNRDFTSRQAHEDNDSHHRFLSCKHCLKVVWDEPPAPRELSSPEAVAQFAERVGVRTPGSRGPTTPIPRGKEVTRRKPGERPLKPKR